MADYVEIRTSVADLLSTANGLRLKGEELTSAMRTAIGRVEMLDGPATFPPDEFTNEFTKQYYKAVPASDGGTTAQNVAVRDSAKMLGTGMINLGQFVADAMWSYQATDDDSGRDLDTTVSS